MDKQFYQTTAEKVHRAVDALHKDKEYWKQIEIAAQALPQDNPDTRQILVQCARQQEQLDKLLRILEKE